jgi:NAD(P)-dependent dehydrogenase (short-subunit alcohol dehydrogenase family)
VLITGGAGGMGLAFAERYGAAGAGLALADLDSTRLAAAEKAMGGDYLAILADVARWMPSNWRRAACAATPFVPAMSTHR